MQEDIDQTYEINARKGYGRLMHIMCINYRRIVLTRALNVLVGGVA